MRAKIRDTVPSGDRENDKCNHQIRDRTRERIDEVANSEALLIHRKGKRITAVGNRAELDEHAKDPTLKQPFADANHDLEYVQVQGPRGQRMTKFVWNRSENSENVE